MNDDPYCRLYHRMADEYPDVWESDTDLALYVRLLRIADMAYPSAATLPYGARKAPLDRLVSAGLVIRETRWTYRIRGMEKHRESRRQSASYAARSRWSDATGNAERIANGNAERIAETMPTRAEHSRAYPSQAEQGDRDAAVAFHERTGRFPSPKLLEWLTDLANRHGEARLAGLIDTMPMMNGASVRDYLQDITDTLRAQDHAADRRERAEERDRLKEKRAQVSPVTAQLRDMLRAREEGAG